MQDLQVVILIQKVEHPVEPQVGQWVGLGGFASLVQIGVVIRKKIAELARRFLKLSAGNCQKTAG